jgi:hypothetical protein
LFAAALVIVMGFTAAACGSSPPALPSDSSPAAVHDLLTGTGGQDFLHAIATYDWDDGGARAGALLGWIGRDATSADPAVATRAGQSAGAIAQFLAKNGDQLQKVPSGLFGTSDEAVGARNPELTRAFASTVTPFLAAIVCDGRGTMGFTPLDPECGRSVEAAKPLFTVLNTEHQAGQTLTDAATAEVDRQVQAFADADPLNYADPALNGLAYAGRLLGLAAVGAEKSGIPARSLHDEVDQAYYVIAKARIAKNHDAVWPEFMENGQLMSPAEVRERRGDSRIDEYYGVLGVYMISKGVFQRIKDDLRGEYERVTGHR